MSIEDAVAKDLVPILFVTFTFGGGALFLVLSVIAENVRKYRVAERYAALKRVMVERGFRADEIVRVMNAGKDADAA
ncbi:MAG: hypothetical protein K2X82_13545 [Gemmataceae bacterium]|nr:hypothetical protein [Gemmataceae bacterium]